MGKIDFIGIGAQKSGTTWIYKSLEEHPEICTTKEKEINFFNKNYSNGINWYESHFTACNEKISGEFSTLYLSSKDIPKKIYNYNKNIKIIVSLRNPVDRAYSHFNHLKTKNYIVNENIQEAIDKYPEIIENGMYGKYLLNYLEIFPRNQILILNYDDLNKNPLIFIKKIYKFLDVNCSFIPSIVSSRYHSTNVRGSFAYKKMNKVYSYLNKSNFGKNFIKFLGLLKINSSSIQNILNLTTFKIPDLKDGEKEYLYNIFKQDINNLEKILEINLNKWKL